MNEVTRQVALHALVVAGANHLAQHSDLTGLEVGLEDVKEALGRVFGAKCPEHDTCLLLGQVREFVGVLLNPHDPFAGHSYRPADGVDSECECHFCGSPRAGYRMFAPEGGCSGALCGWCLINTSAEPIYGDGEGE